MLFSPPRPPTSPAGQSTASSSGLRPSRICRGDNADFADAIKKGKAQANESVSNVLFDLCKAGNITAIIWYEKTRRGLDTSSMGKLEVEIRSSVTHTLTVERLETWLKGGPKNPKEAVLKDRLRSLL